MELNTPKYSGEQKSRDIAREDTLPIPATRGFASTGMLEAKTGNTEEGVSPPSSAMKLCQSWNIPRCLYRLLILQAQLFHGGKRYSASLFC